MTDTVHHPTDHFKFFAVDASRDPVAAARAIGRFLHREIDGVVALENGMFARTSAADDLYRAVRPFGYLVHGKDR